MGLDTVMFSIAMLLEFITTMFSPLWWRFWFLTVMLVELYIRMNPALSGATSFWVLIAE